MCQNKETWGVSFYVKKCSIHVFNCFQICQRLRDEDMPHLSSIKQVIFMNILIVQVQILYQFPQILPHATQFCYNYAGDLCDCRVIIHMLQMFWGNISFVYKLIETGLKWLESSILFRDRNSFIFNHPRVTSLKLLWGQYISQEDQYLFAVCRV